MLCVCVCCANTTIVRDLTIVCTLLYILQFSRRRQRAEKSIFDFRIRERFIFAWFGHGAGRRFVSFCGASCSQLNPECRKVSGRDYAIELIVYYIELNVYCIGAYWKFDCNGISIVHTPQMHYIANLFRNPLRETCKQSPNIQLRLSARPLLIRCHLLVPHLNSMPDDRSHFQLGRNNYAVYLLQLTRQLDIKSHARNRTLDEHNGNCRLCVGLCVYIGMYIWFGLREGVFV